MAVDKLVDSTQLDADLTSVANAIRTKGGTSAQMAFPAGFVSAVNAIPTSQQITFGLIAEINVTEPVASIRQVIPTIAIEYGMLLVDFDLVFSARDYFYVGLVPSGGNLGDSNGYTSTLDAINRVMYPFAIDPSKFGQDYSGLDIKIGTVGLETFRLRDYQSGTVMSELFCRLYNAGSRINSGTVKIYGRIS